jgi:iron complex transport system permease protein
MPLRQTHRSRVSAAAVLGALFGLLIVAIVVCCGVGAFPIGPANIARILLGGLGLATTDGIPTEQKAVLWSIRLPRVTLAVVIGGGLGAAGAAMQALFRNPLADPSLTGVSGGAALAATVSSSWGHVARLADILWHCDPCHSPRLAADCR